MLGKRTEGRYTEYPHLLHDVGGYLLSVKVRVVMLGEL